MTEPLIGQPRLIDLRSDTVTLPTPEMMARMAEAELGDDGLDHDPTAAALETQMARLLGKEAALFAPTCTMANLLSVLTQTGRGDQILTDSASHITNTERGIAVYGAISVRTLPSVRGEMDIQQLSDTITQDRKKVSLPLVTLETSHNAAGGAVPSLQYMAEVRALAHANDASVHLDGARMFNAAAALGVEPCEIAGLVDTVSICLSKGLSAPVGAVLAGPAAVIARSRDLRKTLGGTQRQVGICAAAGIEALEVMRHRLHEDHAVASRFSSAVNSAQTALMASLPETNIVQVDTSATGVVAARWIPVLQELGLAVRAMDRHLIRCVTHRHVSLADAETAAGIFVDAEKRLCSVA